MGKKGDNSNSGNRAEVRVTGSQGHTLPQIEHGGVTYVVSDPGETFEVSVRHWAHKRLSISLAMDGESVGNNHRGYPGSWAVFRGFSEGSGTKRAFVFAKPDCTNSIPASSNTARTEASVGLLEARFYDQVEYACLGATCNLCNDKGHLENTCDKPVIKSVESVAAEEEKKFFLAPSLCVTAGDILTKKQGPSLRVTAGVILTKKQGQRKRKRIHRRALGESLFSARVQCETAEALVLRKVLDPNKPEHAALLPARLREVFARDPTARRAAPVTQEQASQPPDMKPSLGESSVPVGSNTQPGRIVKAEDDEVFVFSVEKPPISVVDLDQMPEQDDDCVILFATGPAKRRRNNYSQVQI